MIAFRVINALLAAGALLFVLLPLVLRRERMGKAGSPRE